MDREPFYALNTHPLVVESLGSSPTRAESDAMLTRYGDELAREGWGSVDRSVVIVDTGRP
jgi:hypothetical protein